MVQLLRNKNLATKFQILVEVAANQPNLQQREIARKLDVTSQAISEYIRELIGEGWLTSDGRSRYRITQEGMNWVLHTFRDLRHYSDFVGRAITNIAVCTAVAHHDLSAGQAVGLAMRDGLLFTSEVTEHRARGNALAAARKGEDVGVSNIEGIVDLVIGKITVLRVPGIQRGGSGNVDLARLANEIAGRKGPLGAMGLPFLIVCADDETPHLLMRLTEAELEYEVIDLREG
ncbi:MAG: winged helix-turn-helix transcriptional regulator [Chloroflexi bacterium]|nr:winged helix-turn-helix transcriptional regulator [Chloroflexota bacterium]